MSESSDVSPGAAPQGPAPDVETTRDLLLLAAEVFARWGIRLQEVAERLPEPAYAPSTDDPLNLPAAVQGLVEGVLTDEIDHTVETLREAAAWLDDPSSWESDPPLAADP